MDAERGMLKFLEAQRLYM